MVIKLHRHKCKYEQSAAVLKELSSLSASSRLSVAARWSLKNADTRKIRDEPIKGTDAPFPGYDVVSKRQNAFPPFNINLSR